MNEKNKNIVVSILFFLFLGVFFLLNVFKSDTLISVSERRKLAQFPEISFKTIFDGTFFEKFESYTTDQFVRRDDFRSLKVQLELGIKHNYNDLYVYNDYIVKQLYPLNENSVTNLSKKVNFIKENYLKNNKIYFSIVPDKNYFIDQGNLKLDYEKMVTLMKTDLNFAQYLDIFPLLSLDNYYKTDTHWKQETLLNVGAYLAEEMDFLFTEGFRLEKITSFLGVYAGQLPGHATYEDINVLQNDVLSQAQVYNYETRKVTEVYDLTKKDDFDKYDIYLSGAVSLMTITNEASLSDRELIVFRDSYGSSLVPLLVTGYKKITLVDTRYISPKILDQYIDFADQDVLFLYSTLLINDSFSLK